MFQQSLNAIRRNFMQLNNKTVIFRSVLAALLFLPLISIAQSYPNRPMKIIAPFPAGGTSDLISRIVAQRLGESLGQSVIVENRPGANGTIGLDAAAKSPADGYTLLICSNGVVLNSPLLYNKLSYDWFRDFSPISMIGIAGQVLVMNPNSPAKTVGELVALAKAKPGEINYGSGGKANTSHLAAEKFKSAAGIDIVHIPYKGNAAATTALVAGEVQLVFSDMAPALPFIANKKLNPLAVTSLQRSTSLPDVPTMAELGFANFESVVWWTLVTQKGVPEPIIQKLNSSLEKIMNSAEVKDSFLRLGVAPLYSSPEKVTEIAKRDSVGAAEQIKKLNLPKE
jgi:tripartite-type tricarboxylate transporter receptor subunit TctC